MPIKIEQVERDSLRERLAKFRQTIKRGQLLEIHEVKAVIGGSREQLTEIVRSNDWGIKTYNDNDRLVWAVFNPKDQKKLCR